jgi:hypothetical protein
MKTILPLLSFFILSPVSAERDSNVYGAYTNPNAVYDYYWATAKNVYQDLNSFKKIYIKYHHCT